jgi:hypothetical protein
MADDALLAELRRVAAEIDAPPSGVTSAARAAIIARDLDGELAVLIGDSRTPEADPLAFEPVRAATEAQGSWLLSFAGGGVEVDMEVSDDRGRVHLVGQLAGASADECYLVFADGERRRLDVDEIGRFVVEDARHGPVCLQCVSAGGTRVTTAWVTI